MLRLLLLVALTITVLAVGDPPNEMTINQGIQESATTSKSMDFLQDDNTLMVELDMKMTKEQYDEYEGAKNGRTKRKGIRGGRWTNNVVPYENIPFSHNVIQAAINDYHQYTCIRFEKARRQSNRIYFTDGGGCSSYVGMIGSRQPVTLANGCRTKGIVIHELGHAVGLHHEQTRPDRDRYVTINFNNIHKNMAYNFKKNDVDALGVPYSYLSVMHYDQFSFSSNGRVTIQAKNSQFQNQMGNRKGFDFADIKILNLMYKCAAHCQQKSCPGEGFMGKDCKCWCPGNPYKHCGGGGGSGGGRPGGGGTSGRGGGGRGGNCFDSNKDCRYWKGEGYCTSSKYGYFMRQNCKSTCGFCNRSFSKKGGACIDQLEKCATWAKNGECDSNPVYMNEVCPKSCTGCRKSFSKKKCKDANPACAAWAKKGMCEQNKKYMQDTCGKSCNPQCQGKA